MYLIWELQLINQLYLWKITLRVRQWSLLRHFFLRRMLLLWSGLLKAQTWILMKMFGKYKRKELRKRFQETSTSYRLIWKVNGRKYPFMNARNYFARVAKDIKLLLKLTVYTSSTNELWTLFSFRYDVSILILWFCQSFWWFWWSFFSFFL